MQKRQAVGLTVLTWVNAAFAAPGTSARFCTYNGQIYAVLQSGGTGATFSALCVTVTLSAVFGKHKPILRVDDGDRADHSSNSCSVTRSSSSGAFECDDFGT